MKIRNIILISLLSLLPSLATAAIINQYHVLTSNSFYSYSEGDGNGGIITDKSTLTGFLLVTIDDVNYTTNIDYSNVLLNGNSFRPIDTLATDLAGINSGTLISGWDGEPNYISYGNSTLSPFPFICVECGYEMTLNLTEKPLVLSYHEYNPYDTGEVAFELYVSQVPIPAAAWLFCSGLIGLLGLAKSKRT